MGGWLADNAPLIGLATLDGLSSAASIFMVAVGLNLVFGVLRVLNVAHGSFYAIGGYAAASLGLLVGAFVARYRDIFFGMLNLAISMVFHSMLDKFYDLTRGSDGMRVPATTLLGAPLTGEARGWAAFALALGLSLAFGALARLYLASPMGEALAGIKTREDRLAFMGVPSRLVLLVAYVLSAVMAGAGGFVSALATGQVTPALSYWTSSGELIFIAILGGTGSVFGPFLGALAYELTRVYAAATLADAWQMVLGAMMLVVILFAPGGLLEVARLRPRRRGPA